MNGSTVRNAVAQDRWTSWMLSLQLAVYGLQGSVGLFLGLLGAAGLFFGLTILGIEWARTGQIHVVGVIFLSIIFVMLPVSVGFLLTSSVGLLFRQISARRLRARMGRAPALAQAWSTAVLWSENQWLSGEMSLVGDQLHFSVDGADGIERQWRLGELQDLQVTRRWGFANGLQWSSPAGDCKVLATDAAGWLRVLTHTSA